MKYEGKTIVDAIYTKTNENNPLIEALPEKLDRLEFIKQTSYKPKKNFVANDFDSKMNYLNSVRSFSHYFDYMYEVYSDIYDCIYTNYKTRNTYVFLTRNIQIEKQIFFLESRTMALLGTPGIGKTSTIKKCLDFFPKMISHTDYKDQKIYFKQIPYLMIECPFDCSIKTLATKIMAEIDAVAGTDYSDINKGKFTLSAVSNYIEKMCSFFHFGVIVIDEIQNVVLTSIKMKQMRLLMKFLLSLSNSSHVSLLFSGTLDADVLFESEDYLKRRTLGKRLLPLKDDRIYHEFIKELWQLQIVGDQFELTQSLIETLYEVSKGIPFYLVEIFILLQKELLIAGKEKFSINEIKKVINKYNINVYPIKEEGISISDFSGSLNAQETKRKRGRPVLQKNNDDIINIYETSQDINALIKKLEDFNMIERTGS